MGIQFYLGVVPAIIISLFCIYFKFILPLIIFSFLGIINVLDLHWAIAIILIIPSLLFLTPAKFKRTFNSNTFSSGYQFRNDNYNFKNKNETMRTNVKNSDVIDGEYKIISDKNDKK